MAQKGTHVCYGTIDAQQLGLALQCFHRFCARFSQPRWRNEKKITFVLFCGELFLPFPESLKIEPIRETFVSKGQLNCCPSTGAQEIRGSQRFYLIRLDVVAVKDFQLVHDVVRLVFQQLDLFLVGFDHPERALDLLQFIVHLRAGRVHHPAQSCERAGQFPE